MVLLVSCLNLQALTFLFVFVLVVVVVASLVLRCHIMETSISKIISVAYLATEKHHS